MVLCTHLMQPNKLCSFRYTENLNLKEMIVIDHRSLACWEQSGTCASFLCGHGQAESIAEKIKIVPQKHNIPPGFCSLFVVLRGWI